MSLRLELGGPSTAVGAVLMGALAFLVSAAPCSAAARGWPSTLEGPLVFQSQGIVTAKIGSRERDRTITMVPVIHGDRLARFDTVVVDHAEDERTFGGPLVVTEGGAVTSALPDLINVGNILGVTPPILTRLLRGETRVTSHGQAEVSGNLYPVTFHHELASSPGASPVKVRTRTVTDDGSFNLETLAIIGADGIPSNALTRGTIKAFATLDVHLTLQRIQPKAGE